MLQVFQAGKRVACSSKCKLARIWHGIFAALDDRDATLVDIAWMPAHTVVTDVGIRTLSNGVAMTANDRCGNGEADRLAKKAAALHRVPERFRMHMATDMEIAKQLGQWIGRATAIAWNYDAPDGNTWRDSRPADRRLRVTPPGVRRVRQVRGTAVPPVPPRQRWANAVQGRTIYEASLRHDTHRLNVTGRVTWCDRCGAYAETRGRGLARPCRGPVTGGNMVGRPLKDVQARAAAGITCW